MKICGISSKKRLLRAKNEADFLKLQKTTRFTFEEIKSIRSRFSRISSNTNHRMNKAQFRENMGLLGLESVFFISDRIFDMIDVDKDSVIDLKEFVRYMDVMVNGSQKEKYLLSFKLVDTENKGYFTFNEFSLMISSMLSVWSALTGGQINFIINKKLDFYIKYIFDEMDCNKNGRISLENYYIALEKSPDLLEIYDLVNSSFSNSSIFDAGVKKYKDQESEKLLINIKNLENDLNKFSSYFKAKKPENSSPSPLISNQDLFFFNKEDQKNSFFPTDRSIKKITKMKENVNRLLKKANLKSADIDEENIPEEDLSERRIFEKMPPFLDISKKAEKIFNFSPIKLSETNEIPKIPLIKGNSFNNEKNYLDLHEIEVNNTIKKLQNQVKVIRYEMELQLNKEIPENDSQKNYSRSKSFTLYNVHKPINQNSKRVNIGGKGKLVFLGHENWNFILNMMLGIQMAAKSVVFYKDYVLAPKDFKVKYCFELIPRRIKNSKETTKICKFFDYAPYVFHEIRTLFGIKTEDYVKSIGPENLLSNLLKGNLTTLTELVSCGKSGSFFYYSTDGKFTLKTVHRAEFHFLKNILKSYYEYLRNNPQTLIIKFFGLHKMKIKQNKSMFCKKVYIIIMSNVFHTSKAIHDRYDIKGSTYNRFTKEKDPSSIQKDMNAIKNNFKVKVTPGKAKILLEQIKNDCKFFENNQIIDYSLLIGVHNKNKKKLYEFKPEISLSMGDINLTGIKSEEEVGIVSADGNYEYFIGIIDILTSFNTKKKCEYLFKTIAINKGISAIPPAPYSLRFQNFIQGLMN